MNKISAQHQQIYAQFPPSGCESVMTIVGYDEVSERWHYFETTCNQWSCRRCGPWKTWQLCKDTEAAKPNRFITLTTADHTSQTPYEVWNFARRQVPELIRWIRKHRGPCEYVRVLEQHESGYPHFHLIVRGPYIHQSTLSTQWCKLTKAFIVDIRRIDPHRAVAKYVAKYLTKQLGKGFTERRVSASKGFFEKRETKAKSDLILTGVKRYRQGLPTTLRYDLPYAEVEQVGPNHWMSTRKTTAKFIDQTHIEKIERMNELVNNEAEHRTMMIREKALKPEAQQAELIGEPPSYNAYLERQKYFESLKIDYR